MNEYGVRFVIEGDAGKAIAVFRLTQAEILGLGPATSTAAGGLDALGDAADTTARRTRKSFEEVRDSAITLLVQPFEQVGTTIAQVQAAKADLDAAFLRSSTTEERQEIDGLRINLDLLEQQMRETAAASSALGAAAGRSGRGADLFGKKSNAARQTLVDFGRTLNDVQQFRGGGLQGFQFGLIAISNNLDLIISGLARTRAGAGSAKGAIAALASGFFGAGGLIVLLNAATTAAVLFGDKIEGAFARSSAAAREAQGAYDDALSSLLKFESGGRTFTLRTAAQASDLLYGAQFEAERLRDQISQLEGMQSRIGLQDVGVARSAEDVERTREQSRMLGAQIESLNGQLAEYVSIQEYATTQLRRFNAEAALASDLQDFGLTPDPEKPTRPDSSAAREMARLFEDLREVRADVQIETLQTEWEREIEAVRRTVAEREAVARSAREKGLLDAEGLEALLTAIHNAGERERAEIDQRYAREAYEEARAWREREGALAELQARVEGATQEEVLRMRQERAEAELAIARREFGEESEAYREALARRLQYQAESADATRQRRERDAEEARRHADRLARIEERRARLAGASDLTILASRLDRYRRELSAAETTAERRRELEYMILDVETEVAEESKRLAQERADAVERYVSRVIGALGEALDYERRYTEAEAELQAMRFDEEAEALRESLRRREIDQREFDLRMRVLAEERARFETDLERDKQGAIRQLLQAGLDFALEIGERALAGFIERKLAEATAHTTAEVAKTTATVTGAAIRGAATAKEQARSLKSAAAKMVDTGAEVSKSAASTAPFPINLVLIAAGIAAVVGLFATLKSALGFAAGGYTGPGGRHTPAGIVHAGEFVLNARATAGNVPELYALQEMLSGGARLQDLLPGYAQGGFVMVRPPASAPPSVTATVARDPRLDRLIGTVEQSVGALDRLARDVARLKAEPPALVIGDAQARLIRERAGAEERKRGSGRPGIVHVRRRGT